MRKLIATLCLTITMLLGAPAQAETVLYCQTELATGFIKKEGTWRVTNFALDRFTVKFNNDYSKLYGLDKRRPYICAPAYKHVPNALACLSGYSNGQSFIFNKETKRFVFSEPRPTGGYASDRSDTDTIMAGTCKNF